MNINFLFVMFIGFVICITIVIFVILKKIYANSEAIDALKELIIEIRDNQFNFIHAIDKFNEFCIDYEKDYNGLLEIIDKQNEIFKNVIASFNRTNNSVVNLCKISQKLIEKYKVDKIANNSLNLNLNDKQIICTIDKIKVVNKSKSASK